MGSVHGLMRSLVDRGTLAVGWLRRRQRLRPTGEAVKVNLGCGMTVAPGWINIDGSLNAFIAAGPCWLHGIGYHLSGARQYQTKAEYCATLRKHRFVHHNLSYGVPLPDASADTIYSSHFLEHLDRHVGRFLLEECLRVLKPGGILRIGVPDLAQAWELYRRGEKQRMLHDYFFVDSATGFSRHRYLYDFEMLAALLTEIGFGEIERLDFRQGRAPDRHLLDNRQEYTLFVEARATRCG